MATVPSATPPPSARVVLLDQRDRVLLLRWTDPRITVPALWTTPGGGLDPGETWEQAAQRELREETGLTDVELGPCVWDRRVLFRFEDEWIDSHERFFLARVEHPTLDHAGMTTTEREYLDTHRWWSVQELRAAASQEVFAPRRLADLLPPLLAGPIPHEPIRLDE